MVLANEWKLLFYILAFVVLGYCANAKADVTLGAAFGASDNAKGATVLTAQYDFKALNQGVYAGAWGFVSEPTGDLHTTTTCTPNKCKKKQTCTTTRYRDDTNIDAAVYAGWQAFKSSDFKVGIGMIVFNESGVMTERRSTVHAMASYRIAGPVELSYQYAGGSFVGIGFNIPLK